ncbi:SDR family NAD(P)-dependent oxidoreductase [Zavarzinia compransoris]|uniref:Short-chain dehydrogenase n=1 Tax=Zavarzinia compransoris TaxID=1264899 RepID=A0A317DUE4_9PROT|nr:SDR family oxidoreductase [Zavarzinia compransoris]PWR18307.1 short-chain dehydrogenase [Zavarzinia compransoris]TDP43636.1 NAD(P)-dependent dehydrogenase (short-subunit alcohol dehydrogenase family) [Zavarzinia compransoris]
MSMFDLTGRVALVTGSTRGIGRAIAEAFAGQGATVVVSGRGQATCTATAEAINAAGLPGRAIGIAGDIGEKTEVEHLAAEAEKQAGPIDILVCNAAVNGYLGPITGIGDDQFRRILEHNLLSPLWLAGLVAPGMTERKRGSIIIVSSVGGIVPSTILGAYGVSKAADFHLARTLATELGPAGVRVNCIAPGVIRTGFSRALWDNPAIAGMVEQRCPMRRLGETDDITGAAVYLASEASRFMTGQTLVLDGGASLGGL